MRQLGPGRARSACDDPQAPLSARNSTSAAVSNEGVGRSGLFGLALLGIASLGAGRYGSQLTSLKRQPPPCGIRPTARTPFLCRVGCDVDVPRKIVHVQPDLSGIDMRHTRGIEIVEIVIDHEGAVADTCLLRGIREDIDARALAAIRQWRFEPARLRHSNPPGEIVTPVMTFSVPIGSR